MPSRWPTWSEPYSWYSGMMTCPALLRTLWVQRRNRRRSARTGHERRARCRERHLAVGLRCVLVCAKRALGLRANRSMVPNLTCSRRRFSKQRRRGPALVLVTVHAKHDRPVVAVHGLRARLRVHDRQPLVHNGDAILRPKADACSLPSGAIRPSSFATCTRVRNGRRAGGDGRKPRLAVATGPIRTAVPQLLGALDRDLAERVVRLWRTEDGEDAAHSVPSYVAAVNGQSAHGTLL